jgi:hypothetical protein
MKLQVGKQYRTRDGSGIALIERDNTENTFDPFPYRGKWLTPPVTYSVASGSEVSFRADGGWDEAHCTDWPQWDLTEEVP